MRESARYSWRETLGEGKYQEGGEVEEKKEKKKDEEHPFVEVLPAEKDPNASEKPKKKEVKEEALEEGAFKDQYGKRGKLSQSSKRKSLGRGSSIKDGAKPSGYESKSEFRSAEKKFSLKPNTKFRTEELSIDDQMRIAREHNRKSKEEKLAANKKAMGDVKKQAPKKDTRTDAQKMTDATGPRPGSRYRGD